MSHTERTERRAERRETGEDDPEEDEPVEIPLSAVTMHPKGTPAPASSVKAQVFEESRVDLSNDMTGRQMIAVGVRRLRSLLEESSIDSRGQDMLLYRVCYDPPQ